MNVRHLIRRGPAAAACLASLLAFAGPALAQNGGRFFSTADGQILNRDGRPVVIRGVGLGGWLVPEGYMLHISAPDGGSPTSIRAQIEDLIGPDDTDTFFEIYREHYVAEKDIAAIAEWGYDHVRLPFHYKDFWDGDTEQIRDEGFDLLDTFFGWCRKYGIDVILDMHAAPGSQNPGNISDSDGTARLWTEPDPYQDWTVAIWTEIATRYADDTLIIGYDLLNEPVLPASVPGSDLRDLYVRLAEAVRAVDPNHTLFIEGNWYATDFSALTTPFDDNMVYAFHKYWNSVDQGTIQYLLDLRAETGVPLWLGETGENSNPWFFDVRRLAETNGIGWNWWTHKKIETITAPTSAPYAPGYETLLDYWNGSGPRPSANFARGALFDMAEGLDLDNTTMNPGVLAALFDDDFDEAPRPFTEHTIPGSIAAVDYDIGNQGVAYGDDDFWATSGSPGVGNSGGAYRNDGVDIEPSSDPQGFDYNVGWIETLEWLRYTITVQEAGTYDVEFRVASVAGGGRFTALLDGEVLGDATVDATGGWQSWRSVWMRSVELPAGEHVLKVSVRRGGFNLNIMRFIKVPNTATEDAGGPTEGPAVLDVYPNPASDRVTVRFRSQQPGDVTVGIVDMLGRRVVTARRKASGPGEHRVSLKLPLRSGLYVVELAAETGDIVRSTQKLLTVIR